MNEGSVIEVMCQLADKITPPNWNITTKHDDFKYIPGTLNICLWFEDSDYIDLDENMGEAGPMHVYKISFLKDAVPEAAEAFKKFGDGSFAKVEIRIKSSCLDLEGTVIHELAHVAVKRYAMWQQKLYKNDLIFPLTNLEEDMHGPLFCGFFRLLLKRAEKVFGKDMVEEQWKHLDYYEKGYHKE